MEKEIKLSFFKRIKMSILDFDKYHIIASEGLGRAMLYLVKLMLLFSLITSFAFIIKTSQIMDEGISYIKAETPNFYFQDNNFYIESDNNIILENHQYIDFKMVLSNAETYNEDEIREFDGTEIVLLKNKVLFKQSDRTSIMVQTYEEINKIYNINGLNKDKILEYFNGENGYTVLANIFAIIFIILFLIYFMAAILDTIALSLLGYIVSRMIRLPLKYGPIFSISISAITLPIIINLLYMIANLFTGFVIPYFQVMYTLVSYVCLIAALLIMKSEIVKKKVKIQLDIINKNKMEEEQEQEKKREKEKEDKEEENSKEDKKGKVEGKINTKKDKPEPQANINEQ